MIYNHLMAKGMFDIEADFGELRKMEKRFKFKRPSQVQAAIRTVLNDEAFLSMRVARQFTLPQKFNIRSKFVQNSVRVKKATGRNVGAMQALVGSIYSPMRDQEFGATRSTKTDVSTEGISTKASRISGSAGKKVSTKNRYNRLGDIKKSNEFRGTSGEHRILVMLRTLASQNYKGAMFIRRSNKFKTGIYKFKGRSKRAKSGGIIKPIIMIKDLSHPTIRIKRKPWLEPSVKRAANKRNVLKFWRRAARRFTTKTR